MGSSRHTRFSTATCISFSNLCLKWTQWKSIQVLQFFRALPDSPLLVPNKTFLNHKITLFPRPVFGSACSDSSLSPGLDMLAGVFLGVAVISGFEISFVDALFA